MHIILIFHGRPLVVIICMLISNFDWGLDPDSGFHPDSGLSQGGTDSCLHPNSGLHPKWVLAFLVVVNNTVHIFIFMLFSSVLILLYE